MERQPCGSRKRVLLEHEAKKKENEKLEWRGCAHDRKVNWMVYSFLNKKTLVIPDKMWELHWIWVRGSGEREQSCDGTSLPFERMVSEQQSLRGGCLTN